MKIYVACPWVHKTVAKEIAGELRTAGFDITSRWHETTHDSNIYEAPPVVMQEEAEKDIFDLSQADAVVYLNLAKSEGKATELGWALAKEVPVYVLGGKMNNVFLHLPEVNHKDNLAEVISCLLN